MGLTAVVLFLTGVDVAFAGMFSGSESVSSGTVSAGCFLAAGAINFNISLWFLGRILARSAIISFLRVDFISSRFSVCTLGDLLVPATGFMLWLLPARGVSISAETSSSTAFFSGF